MSRVPQDGGRVTAATVFDPAQGDTSHWWPVFLPDGDRAPGCAADWLRALGTQYDVSPDGRRVYFMRPNDDPGPVEFQVVVGWSELLTDFK